MNTSQRQKNYISFLDYINGGELFTHLSQRERFTEREVQIYVGEIVLALGHLHKVRRSASGVCLLKTLLTGDDGMKRANVLMCRCVSGGGGGILQTTSSVSVSAFPL